MVLLQLEQIRKYEFDQVAGYFESGQCVLEIGGGNGFQACQIASRGVLVKSLDVKPPRENRYYDVEVYDGRKIPFPDDSFDRVFSLMCWNTWCIWTNCCVRSAGS